MRILVVSQYFWPETFQINEICADLAGMGNDVRVLTGKPNYPEGKLFPNYRAAGRQVEEWRGVKLLRVPIVPRGRKTAVGLALNYVSFVISAGTFGYGMLQGWQPQLVFVFAPSPILQALPAIQIASRCRAPMVLWVQDLWPDSLQATGYVKARLLLGAVRRVVSSIYRRSTLVLVSSRPFEAAVRKFTADVPIAYHPNSVGASFADGVVPPPAQAPRLGDGFNVMFAGNVGSAQAIGTIVDAAHRLKAHPDICIVVVGTGSEYEFLQQKKQSLGLSNLRLLGRHPLDVMPGLLAQASALLVTLSDRPIFAMTVPSKLQAYMAIGRPIIACLNGEGARVVDEAGAGITVPAEDGEGLAHAILALYGLPQEQRDEMAQRAKRYYEQHFSSEYLLSKLMGHFRSVTGIEA